MEEIDYEKINSILEETDKDIEYINSIIKKSETVLNSKD